MAPQFFRVLVVEDHEPWRRFIIARLQTRSDLRIVGEASDGLRAVEQAKELQPDLILLDIGLPTLNGIEAARQIFKVAPQSRILFATENRSSEIVEEALRTGALGYIVKSDAVKQLLPGVDAVLHGMRFISASLAAQLGEHAQAPARNEAPRIDPVPVPAQKTAITVRHDVQLYSLETQLLDRVTQFIATALKAGHAAIIIATDSHRQGLLERLRAFGVDIDTAIQEGRYISLATADALSTFMTNGMPDPDRFLECFATLIDAAARAAKAEPARVAVFGECVQVLCEQGNPEAAIQMEKLGNRLAKSYGLHILCGYSRQTMQRGIQGYLAQICAEHSVVFSD